MVSPSPFIAAGVAVAVAAIAGCSGTSGRKPTPVSVAAPASATGAVTPTAPTITASGQGQASGPPDMLTVTIGVQTNGPTAHGVLATNNTEAAALIAKVESDGVQAKDIQTTQLSLNPVYANPAPNEPPRLTGYAADDTVTISIHQLDRAGAILDDAVSAGGSDTQIQAASYSVQNTGPLIAAAHADAVAKAVAEAKAMAAAAGVTLGPLRAITDVTQPQVVPYNGAMSAAAASPTGAPPVPVQAGTENVTAQVSVSYDVA
jgi:uncharacterized protein YggE